MKEADAEVYMWYDSNSDIPEEAKFCMRGKHPMCLGLGGERMDR